MSKINNHHQQLGRGKKCLTQNLRGNITFPNLNVRLLASRTVSE